MESESAPPLFTIEDDDRPGIERAGWVAFFVGLGLGLLTEVFPLLRVLVGYFVVLVHELGHTLAGWLLGFPSIPAFDFTYGGGVTSHQEQLPLLVAGVYLGLFALAFVFRSNRLSLAIVAGVLALYTGLQLSGGCEAMILAMGHGSELIFASLFIHRAVSGRACRLAIERPLYAWIGFHIVFHDLRFAWDLSSSAVARAMYAEAKGGGHWMDFSRLANEFFGVPLEMVAAAFFALCLLPPVIGLATTWLAPELGELREDLGDVSGSD